MLQTQLTYEEMQNVKSVFASWNALPGRLGIKGKPLETYLLKLKTNAKELDDRFFNETEKRAFAKSDIEEWRNWIRNKAVDTKPLTHDEGKKIPKDKIITSPMRHVRTNKGTGEEDLIAKSRIIIPGHTDPQIGLYRSDAPTTTCLAVFVVAALAVSFDWIGEVFDISSAFLSGLPMERECFARAPRDGLPGVEGVKAIPPYALLRLLKAAYGLQEAPRLWYLQLRTILLAMKFVELKCARAVFVFHELNNGAWRLVAMLVVHVNSRATLSPFRIRERT